MTLWTRAVISLTTSTAVAIVTWLIVNQFRKRRYQRIVDNTDDDDLTDKKFDHFENPQKTTKSAVVDEILQQKIEVEVVNSPELIEQSLLKLKDSIKACGIKVIGLDCEWVTRDGHQNPVSLLQLSSYQYCCLIRLHQANGSIPQLLQEILQNKSILKVGVGVIEDCRKLHRDYDLTVKGCVDLRTFTFRHRPSLRTVITGSLADLCSVILNREIDKTAGVRCSDWECSDLSPEQVAYAADDAISSLQIFLVVALEKLNFTASDLADDDNWRRMLSVCQGITDEKFKQKNQSRHRSRVKGHVMPKKPEINTISKAYSARREPLYHNCRLLAPDGQLLCTCDRKKAEWYVAKGLGEMVNEEPLVIRLKFEPAGRPGSDRNYYLKEKHNQCVVCGTTDSYIRKNVVPHEYRKYFPTRLKEHSSHDVVLLCFACHQLSSNYDSQMRQRIAERYDAPLPNHGYSRFTDDTAIVKVRSAARALKFNSQKLPKKRMEELEKLIKEFHSIDEVTEDVINESIALDAKVSNDDYISHGEKVVAAINKEEGGLIQFEKAWRKHFLNTMTPKFLPELWSVNHRDAEVQEYVDRRNGMTMTALRKTQMDSDVTCNNHVQQHNSNTSTSRAINSNTTLSEN
ncbi:exonuclease 3'-5' domain-containing protein 2-like [Glandiceps talaboti]